MMGLVSRAVPDDKQGLLQGAMGSLQTATGAFSAPLMTGAFGFFVGSSAPVVLPGAPFFLGAVFFVIALTIVLAGRAQYAGLRPAEGRQA
jgi:DHA1 family tetracycline resistance protein-like MFS transporter